jgi:hypothetical protein
MHLPCTKCDFSNIKTNDRFENILVKFSRIPKFDSLNSTLLQIWLMKLYILLLYENYRLNGSNFVELNFKNTLFVLLE